MASAKPVPRVSPTAERIVLRDIDHVSETSDLIGATGPPRGSGDARRQERDKPGDLGRVDEPPGRLFADHAGDDVVRLIPRRRM